MLFSRWEGGEGEGGRGDDDSREFNLRPLGTVVSYMDRVLETGYVVFFFISRGFEDAVKKNVLLRCAFFFYGRRACACARVCLSQTVVSL